MSCIELWISHDANRRLGGKKMELIERKMSLPEDGAPLARTRLLAALENSLSVCSATVLDGRVGTGKTLLAADFARQCGREVAWYKVDATDSEIGNFLHYLIECVAKLRPGFGTRTRNSATQTPASASYSTLAELYIDDLQRLEQPLLLVLDDLHQVYDAEWFVPFFNRLISLLPCEVHLLILARSFPPAPLWRNRSKQRLCVIDEEALAFTLHEAEELYLSYGLGYQEAKIAHKLSRGVASVLHSEAKASTFLKSFRSSGSAKGVTKPFPWQGQ